MLPKVTLLVLFLLVPAGCRRQRAEVHRESITVPSISDVTKADAGAVPATQSKLEFSTAAFIGVKSPQEASAKLEREDLDLFTELGNAATGSLEKREKPTSCREWRRVKMKGYSPLSDLAEQVDDGAKVFCTTLELLEKAPPARSSHLRELEWNASMLEALPPDIHPATSPSDRQSVREASAKGLSFKQFRPAAKFERIRRELEGERFFRIEDPDANSVILGRFLAFADVDADGTEDLLLSIVNLDAESEAFLEQRLFALSRHTKQQVSKAVHVE